MDDLGVLLGRIEQKMDGVVKDLADFKIEQAKANERIESKQDYTNGRVRGLELFKARVLTVVAVGVFATPILLPVVLHG